MTDPTPNAPVPEPLSPAAQAVLDAVFDHWPGGYNHPGKPRCVAAAICELADQVVPENQFGPPKNAAAAQREITRAAILAIATELEGLQ